MFKEKSVLILGLARSGYMAAITLNKLGAKVIVNDASDEEKLNKDNVNNLKNLNIECIFGHHPDNLVNSKLDYIVKNPGIRNDHKYITLANKLHIKVINEVELFYMLKPKNIKIISITGTNGKTTTTTLTYNILKSANLPVHLAGNIGYPMCSLLDKLNDNDIVVSEISCQQLANTDTFNPNIALLTNLSPAHIDFFGSYNKYKETKIKLFKNQSESDLAILNNDNLDSLEYLSNIKAKKLFFSIKDTKNAYMKDNKFFYNDEFIMNRSDMFLKGNHNVLNALSAITIAKQFNVSNEVIIKVLKEFKGVEHRLELVDTVNGVSFYNDTEATNIKCTQIALSSFDNPIILLLGGLERGQDFNELKPFMKHVKKIIAIGECRERVEEFSKSVNIECFSFEFLRDGFKKAIELSENKDTVLLSPASASWDQYKECEERGLEFKKLVSDYKNN